MGFIRWLLKSSFVQSFATKEVRHLATLAAGFVLAYLQAHNATQSDAASIAEGVSALIVGGAGYGLSVLNASGNASVAKVAAQTGLVVPKAQASALEQQGVGAKAQLAVDAGQVAQVQKIINQADLTAPATKAALLADLSGIDGARA